MIQEKGKQNRETKKGNKKEKGGKKNVEILRK